MRWITLFVLLPTLLSANPWGKDADLAYTKHATAAAVTPCQTPVLGTFSEKAIAFHQNVISPCDGPRSHYLPSSSQYTLEAMRKHGFFCGFALGCDRLMRENDDEWKYRMVQNEHGQYLKWNPIP